MDDFIISFKRFGDFGNFDDWAAAEQKKRREYKRKKERRRKEVTTAERTKGPYIVKEVTTAERTKGPYIVKEVTTAERTKEVTTAERTMGPYIALALSFIVNTATQASGAIHEMQSTAHTPGGSRVTGDFAGDILSDL